LNASPVSRECGTTMAAAGCFRSSQLLMAPAGCLDQRVDVNGVNLVVNVVHASRQSCSIVRVVGHRQVWAAVLLIATSTLGSALSMVHVTYSSIAWSSRHELPGSAAGFVQLRWELCCQGGWKQHQEVLAWAYCTGLANPSDMDCTSGMFVFAATVMGMLGVAVFACLQL